jgi:hypothetical protein
MRVPPAPIIIRAGGLARGPAVVTGAGQAGNVVGLVSSPAGSIGTRAILYSGIDIAYRFRYTKSGQPQSFSYAACRVCTEWIRGTSSLDDRSKR